MGELAREATILIGDDPFGQDRGAIETFVKLLWSRLETLRGNLLRPAKERNSSSFSHHSADLKAALSKRQLSKENVLQGEADQEIFEFFYHHMQKHAGLILGADSTSRRVDFSVKIRYWRELFAECLNDHWAPLETARKRLAKEMDPTFADVLELSGPDSQLNLGEILPHQEQHHTPQVTGSATSQANQFFANLFPERS